ncbi:MAG: hypothetical protein JXE06_02460 [Coriobacteriia bacterium]|nr:hypothetical protein [Coriobacteriia bacterium]
MATLTTDAKTAPQYLSIIDLSGAVATRTVQISPSAVYHGLGWLPGEKGLLSVFCEARGNRGASLVTLDLQGAATPIAALSPGAFFSGPGVIDADPDGRFVFVAESAITPQWWLVDVQRPTEPNDRTVRVAGVQARDVDWAMLSPNGHFLVYEASYKREAGDNGKAGVAKGLRFGVLPDGQQDWLSPASIVGTQGLWEWSQDGRVLAGRMAHDEIPVDDFINAGLSDWRCFRVINFGSRTITRQILACGKGGGGRTSGPHPHGVYIAPESSRFPEAP